MSWETFVISSVFIRSLFICFIIASSRPSSTWFRRSAASLWAPFIFPVSIFCSSLPATISRRLYMITCSPIALRTICMKRTISTITATNMKNLGVQYPFQNPNLLQKCRDSYRINNEDKQLLLNYKR